ncbi:MAG: FAD-dependent monooxygenase, partial [Actinomycetota bacterium]|nr:FAD-dependent monooxygenase [Actinomycetota bacterium]
MNAQVAIVGAGPVGLTLALRLADLGVDSVLLEARDRPVDGGSTAPASGGSKAPAEGGSKAPAEGGSKAPAAGGSKAPAAGGSKALCMQQETLESWARLGLGEEVARRGVSWHLGRTYYRDVELFQTRLGGGGDHFPPFVNISQSEVEALLAGRAEASPRVQLLWAHRLERLDQRADDVLLGVQTPTGPRVVSAAYCVGTDGARSAVRQLLGIPFLGHSHEDKFLIADVRCELPFPNERRFFFDPPWNPRRQVLVHPQPDGVWRIDWQVPPDTDRDEELRTGRLDQRIRRIVGDAPYELVWLSVYRFHQRVADRFGAGRAFLAGDAAHLMSPFGARGLNSGVADAENLAWKLAFVLTGRAPATLLATYGEERRAAALENLRVTDETMRFMVPPGPLARRRRNAILRLSRWVPPLRRHVNSGRLAEPFVYPPSRIVEPGCGFVLPDGPVSGVADATRLRELIHGDVIGVLLAPPAVVPELPPVATPLVVVVPPDGPVPTAPGAVVAVDRDGVVARALCDDGMPPAGRLLVVRP